ncbi:MAG: nicotinate-nucleotide--dimethylbenzimidazole phosphoribosyltransferase [Solirubrobacteraceae bacterium MAG38_C4-C5]|nr:nicotinate-nucleotide--dimethylbenzimidazole phosphoribosyltransferase [Candidatus Siliceabacter maunaloa]
MEAGREPLAHRPPSLAIAPLDEAARRAARERQAQLVKPAGALGRLEELAIWLAGVTGSARPSVRARVVVAAADHGVAEERVSAFPQAVTRQMLAVFLTGRGAVSVLARETGAELVVVDAGVLGEEPEESAGARPPGLAGASPPSPATSAQSDCGLLAPMRLGLSPSRNLAREAALTAEEVALAVDAGRSLAAQAAADGITILVGGEMGIANTTPAACLAAALTGRPAAELVGPGTGVDAAGLERKREVVERALALHGDGLRGPLGALRRVGGGELAVLCGLALGAGEHGLGFVCDGVIATAGAAVAAALEPALLPRLLAGHRSPEPAHDALLGHLGLEPVLDLGMRLGEGSGATAALAILRLAAAAHDGMATFADAGVVGRG